MDKQVSRFLRRIAKKGGKSTSIKKIEAARKNVEKARLVRIQKLSSKEE